MWTTLTRGVFIYGTHMTRNITANNTTNTQTLVHFPGQKKLLNKCHTNHLVVVKPLNKQATVLVWGSQLLTKSWVSIPAPYTSVIFVCLDLSEAPCVALWKVGGATASQVIFFISLRILCANHTTCALESDLSFTCSAHSNGLLSFK